MLSSIIMSYGFCFKTYQRHMIESTVICWILLCNVSNYRIPLVNSFLICSLDAQIESSQTSVFLNRMTSLLGSIKARSYRRYCGVSTTTHSFVKYPVDVQSVIS